MILWVNIRKMRRILLIRCSKCGNKMKYMTDADISSLNKKIKRCVYCGFSNKVSKAIVK